MPNIMYKAAQLQAQDVTEAELKEINKLTMSPLTADEVFTFSAILCDNELDRQYEHFSEKALNDMRKLYVGRTVIKDHQPKADNQIARIYATELVKTDRTNAFSEPYTQLKAHCYMVKTDSNKDLIAEIRAGIKKEGSVGFRPAAAYCSICGTDNTKSYCSHWPGRKYRKDGGDTICTYKLDSVSDTYEFSLVAVPAQRAAGVSKSYMDETVDAPAEAPVNDTEKAQELALRARLMAIKNH